MRHRILQQLLVFVLVVLAGKTWGSTVEMKELSVLSINSAITPAAFDYLKQNFTKLPKSSLIVLKLNTPGGLVTTTKDIITLIGREKRPIVVWITPEGASAASAGAIIASAAHYIFMSPGTNMGAATPVGLGDDIKESDGKQKALNDLTALVRSLSASRRRPSAPFEKMITKAESFTDREALALGIIDGVVSNERDILPYLSRKKIILDGTETTLTFSDLPIREYEATLGQKILEVLANPQTAYFLFLIGVALIYFEFQAPGGFISGTIGTSFLILAGISFQVLPLDWGSFALMILGIFLLVLELYVVSYGILAIAGLVSFVTGSLFLFHGETGYISVSYPVILSTLGGVLSALSLILFVLWREKRRRKIEDFHMPVGSQGVVLNKKGPRDYQVKVRGEIWRANSLDELVANENVVVIEVDPAKLIIQVKRA